MIIPMHLVALFQVLKEKPVPTSTFSLCRNPVNLGFSLTPLLISILSILQTRSLDQPLIMEMTNILNG
jgi:hypothetical protein